jgi:type IV pilus assembly protein PilO
MKLAARVSPRRVALVLLAAVAAISLLDWRWLGGPRWAALAERRARLADRGVALETARREAASLARTKRAVHDAARALRLAEARLPAERELAALLADVAASARASGLELILLRPKPERLADDHAEVPLEMQVRGTFHETVAFLARVGGLSRLVRVVGLRVERREQAGERTVLRVTCDAATFRFVAGARGRRGAATRGAHG